MPAATKAEWKRPLKRRVVAIRDRLREMYGKPVNEPHEDPVHELVLTILSQNTSDTNRDVAYAGLRARFDSWPEVRDAPTDELEESIRRGGLAPTKAPRIQAVLRELGDPIDLDWLAEAPREEALAYLTALPGVGRKTAACVMIFSFDRPEIPGGHARPPRRRPAGPLQVERVMGGGTRRDASGDPARGRLRAPREPDSPRPDALPARSAEVRRMRASSNVPLREGAPGQR